MATWALTDAICHEDSRGHEALLRMASNIRHANSNNQTNSAAEEPRDRIANDGGGSVVRPLALPDHGTPGYHGQTR